MVWHEFILHTRLKNYTILQKWCSIAQSGNTVQKHQCGNQARAGWETVQKQQKHRWYIVLHVSIRGELGKLFGGLSPPKPPVATRLDSTDDHFFKAPEMLFADILSHWNKAWAEEKVALNNV